MDDFERGTEGFDPAAFREGMEAFREQMLRDPGLNIYRKVNRENGNQEYRESTTDYNRDTGGRAGDRWEDGGFRSRNVKRHESI